MCINYEIISISQPYVVKELLVGVSFPESYPAQVSRQPLKTNLLVIAFKHLEIISRNLAEKIINLFEIEICMA